MSRLTLLLSSPRLAPGLLSRDAWQALEDAGDAVYARDDGEPQAHGIQRAGVPVTHVGHASAGELARTLTDRAESAPVVWVGSADGDPGLTDALAAEVSRRPEPPEVEVLVGSWDTPGARLLDAVAVMDRLRSPGGCPWDAQQTHASLVPYLVEETHEAVEAMESGDPAHMAEELGDVLLQVLFHARIAQEEPGGFDIDAVAGGLVEKLVRRHPHVFAGQDVESAEHVEANWEQIKAAEKGHRSSPLEGIAAGMPPLARADKVASRLSRAGMDEVLRAAADADRAPDAAGRLGAELFGLVLRARADGLDPSAALRRVLRELERQVSAAP